MKPALLAAVLIAGPVQAPAQSSELIPEPRSWKLGQGELVLRAPVRIYLASESPEDRFAAGLLVEDLKSVHHIEAALGPAAQAQIRLLRAGRPEAEREIGRLGLDRAPLEHPEGYLLHIDRSAAVVAARSASGLFYGVQSLRQLIRSKGRAPAISIADWPALRHRGLSVDVSRGPILTEDQMKLLVRTAAEYKLNLLSFYMEHVFAYRHAPLVAPEGGELTPELARRLSAYARRYHVELVPQQQIFGHLHHMLKHERYAGMAEVPFGGVLTPEDERTYEWIQGAASQLAETFPSRFLHIGCDETWELGEGRSRARALRDGVGRVYLGHLRRVAGILGPLNRELMFWGDIALNHKELIPELPRNLVAMSWTYDPKEDFSSYIAPFREAGLKVFVCPGLNNWNRIYPNLSNAIPNINHFVRDGKRMGAAGMLNTHWADDGEALFNLNWYGILFSAAAAWQQGLVDPERFDKAFDWAFYRNEGGVFAAVIRRLDRVHHLLRSTGAGDAANRLFWLDTFSRSGSALAAKILPAASEIRMLAEGALVDLEANRRRARRHEATLAFLRLAAKRLDYLGMKVQFSHRISELYHQALTHPDNASLVTRSLGKINSTNGLVQDLRDGANELKQLHRTAWLAENRPYWLDNVLVRYEHEALYWTQKSLQFTEASRRYAMTRKLPEREELGLFIP